MAWGTGRISAKNHMGGSARSPAGGRGGPWDFTAAGWDFMGQGREKRRFRPFSVCYSPRILAWPGDPGDVPETSYGWVGHEPGKRPGWFLGFYGRLIGFYRPRKGKEAISAIFCVL